MISKEKYIKICESFGLKVQGTSAWKVGLIPDNYHFKEISIGAEVCRYIGARNHYIGFWPCRIEDGKLISHDGTAKDIRTEADLIAHLKQQSKVFAQAIKERRFNKIKEL